METSVEALIAQSGTNEGDRRTGPLVSAVIPAYNSEETIARALESALAQTYHPLEIIVVDDFSSDQTIEIVESFAERGVRLIRKRSLNTVTIVD